jgi:hypothetical protein
MWIDVTEIKEVMGAPITDLNGVIRILQHFGHVVKVSE